MSSLNFARSPVAHPALYLAPAVVLLFAGCAAPEGNRGQVRLAAATGSSGLGIGEAAPDFEFVDAGGKPTRFSAVRGGITVVVFPDNPDVWPEPDCFRRQADLARRLAAPGVSVVIVNVGHPARSLDQVSRVLSSAPVRSRELFMVADPDALIRERYGPKAAGHFYVVDSYGKIVTVGEFHQPDSLRQPVEKAVRMAADEIPEQNG